MNPFEDIGNNETYFGDNYYNFERNSNNFYDRNTNRPQMRPQFPPKQPLSHGNSNPILPNNERPLGVNSYRRTHPYYGQNGRQFGGQYRAQVIDYSNSSQCLPINDPSLGFQPNIGPNNSRPQSGLLPTPQAYPNARAYGRPSHPQLSSHNQNSGILPAPNRMNHQRFGSIPPQQQHLNSYSPNNHSISQTFPPINQSYNQSMSKPVPQPVPPPVPPPPTPVPPVAQQKSNQPLMKGKSTVDYENQRKLDKSRTDKILSDGMVAKVQNGLNGYYCLFCEVFCINLLTSERHVESPKHQRTKIGDNLKGIDAKYTVKSERISETAVALARKEELNKISNVLKNEYFNEGIRLKDGVGPEAYICENCGVCADSLTAVNKHLELHKQFTEQLKICSKPVIGLDFVTEYIDPDPQKARIYECTMCKMFSSTRDIITHVCSFTHRTNFIKKIHPSEGAKYTSETQQLSLEAGKRALELETLVGRGQFRVKHTSAPQNCLLQIQYNYSNSAVEPSPPPEPAPTPKPPSPVIQIDLPKVETEIEKLFSVKLNSDSEADEVTDIIKNITNSVMEYHMKGMTPEMREQFRRQIKDNETNN